MPSTRDKLITDNMRLVYHMYGKIGDGPIKENYKEDIISEEIGRASCRERV